MAFTVLRHGSFESKEDPGYYLVPNDEEVGGGFKIGAAKNFEVTHQSSHRQAWCVVLWCTVVWLSAYRTAEKGGDICDGVPEFSDEEVDDEGFLLVHEHRKAGLRDPCEVRALLDAVVCTSWWWMQQLPLPRACSPLATATVPAV